MIFPMNGRIGALLLSVVALFSACEGVGGKLKLVEGNFYFSRGMMNEAIGAYLLAREAPALAPYADFAIGAAYLVLEETDAALERFVKAEEGLRVPEENRTLLYRIRYNSGVVRFERGDFKGAADDFKSALIVDSSAREAKRNLELSRISLQMKNQASAIEEIQTSAIADEQDGRQGEIIFDFVRKKEFQRWKSWEWAGDEAQSGADY
jgi:Ca-activated chloride channel family protein